MYFGSRLQHGVTLDHDAGISDRGGRKVENIVVDDLEPITRIIFATKIFGDGDRYSDYDGAVEVIPSDVSKFVVPLTTQQRGRWCWIARIELDRNGTTVWNLSQVSDDEPVL